MQTPRVASQPTDGATEAGGSMPGGVCAPNARALARWWARSANGVLRIEGEIDGVPQSALVLLAAGGPVGDDGLDGIRIALRGGALSFDPMDADEPGNRAALADLLWEAARTATEGEPLSEALVVMPGASPSLLNSPMDCNVAAILVEVREPTTLAALADIIEVDAVIVVEEVAVTTWLGITTLKESHTLSERRGQAAAPPLLVPKSTLAAKTLPPASVPRPVGTTLPTASATTLRPAGAPVAPASASGFRPLGAPPPPPAAPTIPITRLRREAELLRHSDGWTALGIPRGSPRELIGKAATRQRQRYQELLKDPNPDARTYAQEILRHVSDAEQSLLAAGTMDDLDPVAAEHAAAGGVALERGDFPRADRQYSAARRLAPNDPAVLAHLAWARFKNPELKKPAREEEAGEFIGLALQFDPECAVAWRYKGEMARAHGDLEGARAALQTAAKLTRR